jgi:hypothetical protein
VQEELAPTSRWSTDIVPDAEVATLSLPLGIFPEDRELAAAGSGTGDYEHEGVLLVGYEPGALAVPRRVRPGLAIPRIQTHPDPDFEFGSAWWLESARGRRGYRPLRLRRRPGHDLVPGRAGRRARSRARGPRQPVLTSPPAQTPERLPPIDRERPCVHDTDRLLTAAPGHVAGRPPRRGRWGGPRTALALDPRRGDRARSTRPACAAAAVRASRRRRKWRGVRRPRRRRRPADAGRQRRRGRARHLQGPVLIEQQPYAFLEGICIALHARCRRPPTSASRRSSPGRCERLRRRSTEVVAAGWPGADRIEIVPGPDAYLFGEETGDARGHRGQAADAPARPSPSSRASTPPPPCPNPTIVNNVETLSHVARILANGADWFREAGTEESPGTMVFTVVGDVPDPGVYELPLGTPLRTLLEDIAGATDIKAVYSGVSNAVITPDLLDTPLCFDAMKRGRPRAGLGRVHRLRLEPLASSTCCERAGELPRRRVLRAVQRLQARQRRDGRDPGQGPARRGTPTDLERCCAATRR